VHQRGLLAVRDWGASLHGTILTCTSPCSFHSQQKFLRQLVVVNSTSLALQATRNQKCVSCYFLCATKIARIARQEEYRSPSMDTTTSSSPQKSSRPAPLGIAPCDDAPPRPISTASGFMHQQLVELEKLDLPSNR
jgi:hypothetical protein